MAIEKEGADLVLCGRKALDSETWQVPSQVAAFLGWPHVTNVAGVERSGDMLRLTRQTDFGEEVYEAGLPVVVSVGLPPEQETSGDADGPIEVWQATDLVGQVFEYDKRFGQTGSPTRVLAVRDSRPERAGIRAADGDEAAAKVRDLLAERAPEAPSWEKPAHIAEEPAASYDCWSVCELIDGRPRRVSLELIARSRELAGKLGGRAVALLIGHELDEPAREAAQHGAEVLYLADDPALAEYHPELWTAVLRRVLVEHLPRVMLVPATGRGRDYGPRTAGELELGMTADCVGVDIAKAGRLLQQKPAYGGNIVSVILGATTPQLATVLPRMYEPLEPQDFDAEVHRLDLGSLPEPRVRVVERARSWSSYDLDENDVVVGVGPSVDPELLDEIRGMGAAVAGTREACEAGVVPRTCQVGLLGRPVAPRLYVGIGVGDDLEHWGGVVKARVIVTIGDETPDEADVSISGDPREILPTLLDSVTPAA
jgi:electron transfer flavoprotein alpha subunit